jgi:hypothetical protein
MANASYLKKYTVDDLREFIRGEQVAFKGFSKLNRAAIEGLIVEEHKETGVFKQLFKDELFWPPIIATTKQLKAATAKVKKILQLPSRDQRAQLKTNVERRLYRKLKWKAQRNEAGDVDFEVK